MWTRPDIAYAISKLSKFMQPRQNVPDKELEGYIFECERGFEAYHKATGGPGISDKQHMLFLMSRCSQALRQHLQYREFAHR